VCRQGKPVPKGGMQEAFFKQAANGFQGLKGFL